MATTHLTAHPHNKDLECLSRLFLDPAESDYPYLQSSYFEPVLLEITNGAMRGFQNIDESEDNQEGEDEDSRSQIRNHFGPSAMNAALVFPPPAFNHTGRPMGGFGQELSALALARVPQHFAGRDAQLPPFHRSSSTTSSASTATSRRDSLKGEKTPLGPDFVPGPWHVVSLLRYVGTFSLHRHPRRVSPKSLFLYFSSFH